MMAQRYDICTGRKDGSGKTYWVKIGAMFPAKEGEGFSIKLDALPLPDDRGQVWVSAFVPREGESRGQTARQAGSRNGNGRSAPAEPDDDIPF